MRTCEKLKPISDKNRIKKFLKDRKLEENSSTAIFIQFKPNRQGIQIYRRVFCYAQQIIIKDVLRFHFPIIFFPHFFFDHFTTNIHISLFFLSISVSRSQTGFALKPHSDAFPQTRFCASLPRLFHSLSHKCNPIVSRRTRTNGSAILRGA